MSRFSIPTPADFTLARDACSYGYFLLWPNYWDVRRQRMQRALLLPGGPALLTVSQAGASKALNVSASRKLSKVDAADAKRQLVRVLRLHETADELQAFHALDDRWKSNGRGRLMRSASLFEDILKTVTSCNVTWPSTVVMNRRLCEVLGEPVGDRTALVTHTFPTAEKLARTRPQTLRARCRVGYRDARIIELAKMFVRGEIKTEWFEDPSVDDETVREALLELPGIGPYAAANILQLLGRYGHLPLDTESVRHGKTVLGFKGSSSQVMKRVRKHFEPFGKHAFRSYWFELWEFYERKVGPSHTWERDSTGKVFTAAQLNR